MSMFRKRWVALLLCAIMILISFCIAQQKQQRMPEVSNLEETEWYVELLPSSVRNVPETERGMAIFGTILFVCMIAVLSFVAVIASLFRVGRRVFRKVSPENDRKHT